MCGYVLPLSSRLLGPLPAQFFSPTLYENHRDDASQIAPLASCSTPVAIDAADDHNGQQIKAVSKSKTSCTEGDHRVEMENDQDENGPSNQPHTYGALLR